MPQREHEFEANWTGGARRLAGKGTSKSPDAIRQLRIRDLASHPRHQSRIERQVLPLFVGIS